MLGVRKTLVSLLSPVLLIPALAALAAQPKPPQNPARIEVRVSPEPTSPGDQVEVSVRLDPLDGIKINRYPKIQLSVPATEGLVAAAEVSVGNDAPPPPDRLEANYFKTVDPLILTLNVDPAARAGDHSIEGKLRYFYCVIESGFCAPARVALKIPISVE